MKLVKLALAASVVALGAAPAIAQEVTLRCQHFISPKGAVPARFMEPWIEKVEAEAGGKLKIELYPGMQLGGKPPALYDQIRDGVIDCGWALPAYTPGRFPASEAMELPFMTTLSAEKTSQAAWDYIAKHGQETFKDVHLIAVHVHGQGVVHKKGDPIMAASEFDGLKLRGPSRQANGILEALGATPVGMPVPAFPEALSKGVVDGGVIPWEIVVPLKVHELADSHTVVNLDDRAMYNTMFLWAMNKDSYAALPDDIKAVIDANSGVETSAWAGRAMDSADADMFKIIEATGNKIHELDKGEVAKIKAIGDAQVAKWIEDMNGKGLNGQAMYDDAAALVAQYNQ
ncbi:MAG: TRAP transporter substrate-binding protein [Pseudomonadota bacterium]